GRAGAAFGISSGSAGAGVSAGSARVGVAGGVGGRRGPVAGPGAALAGGEPVPDPGDPQEVLDLLGRLGPLREPVQRPVPVDVDQRRVLQRVVLPDVLDE